MSLFYTGVFPTSDVATMTSNFLGSYNEVIINSISGWQMGEKGCKDIPILPHNYLRNGEGRDVRIAFEAVPSGINTIKHIFL